MIPLRDNIPSKSFPIVNWIFIAANCYVFYLELKTGGGSNLERFVHQWAAMPQKIHSDLGHYGYTLVTAMFLHGGWLHILSNMLFLYIFGDNVEDRMGHFRYAVFYLLAGVIANGTQVFFSLTSTVPLIGASGAIAGVLGSYFFYFPHAQVETLIPIFFFITIREIPAFIFLGYWFILQTLSSTFSITHHVASAHQAGGIAFIAHAAGFVSGLLMSPIFGRKTSRFR